MFNVPIFSVFCYVHATGVPLASISTQAIVSPSNTVQVSPSSTVQVSTAITTPARQRQFDFEIPWNKMSAVLMTAITNKERPVASMRREMVRIICADIQDVCPGGPGRRQLRQLAEKIVLQYPASFRDQFDGDVVGSGFDSLLFQLEERLSNINRGNKMVKRRLADGPTVDGSSKPDSSRSKKTCPRDYYGCISWQPPMPTDKELESLKQKQSTLKTMASDPAPDPKVIVNLMEQTYCLQRLDINSGLDAGALADLWPFLLTPQGISTHFRQLTDIDLLEVMAAAFNQKGTALLKYFQACSKKCATVLAMLESAKQELENESPTVIALVLLLQAHFGEKNDAIIIVKDVSSSIT